MPAHPLTKPETFASEFFRVANKNDRPPRGNKPATRWFEQRMLDLAKATTPNLHCQNHGQSPSGEWMKIDHVFVEKNLYECFPLIAVEHENGDLSQPSKQGSLPDGDRKAHIEWAMWKVLAMQAHLRVLVAYPWKNDEDNALNVLTTMIQGYERTYRELPNVLLLLGWWYKNPPNDRNWRAENLYTAYKPAREEGGTKLIPLSV